MLQELIEQFHRLTGILVGIVDLHGRILIGVGWQVCCMHFHGVNPETCRFCIESDLTLSSGIPFWRVPPVPVPEQHVGRRHIDHGWWPACG
ncbi:PocR ligand-binding domain-containing protein [Methanosphaerula palustris]|uniref:PocR ligand-binding domain-containing protein n=1 Tax=Methanosphaerula palustris TaxID=475088 RepID=UPI0003238FF0